MNQDLTYRFPILMDRRQQSLSTLAFIAQNPSQNNVHYFSSVVDLHPVFNAFSSNKNSLYKKSKYNEEQLEVFMIVSGIYFLQENKKTCIFGSPQSKEAHAAFFRLAHKLRMTAKQAISEHINKTLY